MAIKQYTCWLCGHKLYRSEAVKSEMPGKWICMYEYQCLQRMAQKRGT